MANEAFVHGFDLGYGRADEQRLHAQALTDQEHQQKITDLITQRQEIASKIPTLDQSTPEYAQAHEALQKVNLDLADAYHPAKNPGAIQKLGHLLTDHVGLTNPQDRAAKLATQQQAKTTAAGQATDREIAAQPLTALQLSTQKMQKQLDMIDKGPLSDEDKAEAKRAVFGVKTKANYQQFKLPDGTIGYYDVTQPDTIPEGATAIPKGSVTTAKETIAGYEDAVKKGYQGSYPQWVAEQRRLGAPSTSALNEYAASYQKAYGITAAEMTPADWDFIQRKQAFDKAIPQTTTSNTLKQNAEQQWVPIQETNTKSPGGGAPVPPRGKPANNTPPPSSAAPASPAAGASPSAAASAPPTSPRALKDEAKKRNPKTSDDSTGSSRGANASVKVGDPLMAAPNKEYQDAKTAYDGAIHRKNLMHKNLADGLKGNQQAMLSLVANHIGMTLGAQKGARINQAVWNEAVESAPWLKKAEAKWGPEGYLSGVTLTPEQMQQMVELADESTEVTKEDLERIHKRINEGVQNKSNSPTGENEKKAPDVAKAKGSVSIAKAKTMEKYKHMTDDQIRKEITKQGYIPTEP